MNFCSDDSDSIYTCTKLFQCKEIKLVAWIGNDKRETLILFTGDGDFVYYNLDLEKPVIKQISWFKSRDHEPVFICFSPNGCFLLVLSRSCHLYIVPVCFFFDCPFQCNKIFNAADVTIHWYPFNSKKDIKTTSSSSTQNESMLKQSNKYQSSTYVHINCTGENDLILKEVPCALNEVSPSAICWWQHASQEIGIIGAKSGDIIFVDLLTGIKIGESNIKSAIKTFSLCQDTSEDVWFLLITLDNNEQCKLSLDSKLLLPTNQNEKSLKNNEIRDCGSTPPFQSSLDPPSEMAASQSPISRTRLQGLKQISAGTLASLKHKIAETRSKISTKQETSEESLDKTSNFESLMPEVIGSPTEGAILFPQQSFKGRFMANYNDSSQLLTIFSLNSEFVPISTHKMPPDTGDVLLGDKLILVTSKGRRSIQIISSKMTAIETEQEYEFNAILGKWCFDGEGCPRETTKDEKIPSPSTDVQEDSPEVILSVVESTLNCSDNCLNDDSAQVYDLKNFKEYFLEFPAAENFFVITSKSVLMLHLKSNLLKMVLDFILIEHELEKAKRICTIFQIDFSKLLELAGDIKLKTSEFTTAIALYKLSKCGLLKSIVKLACASHCSQVLNYSLMLMSNSISEMSLTEKIHLSNLIVLAYTQQVLRMENNQKFLEKFTEFLLANPYFDEVLAINVTGQSFLFTCFHKLIVNRGLILDGYNVLIKLMERFSTSGAQDWNINMNEFWNCATEISLIEAIVFNVSAFSTFLNYTSENLNRLNLESLKRLSAMLDPTAFCLRPLSAIHQNSEVSTCETDVSQSIFPFGKLVELFLLTLLAKVHINKNKQNDYQRRFLHLMPQKDSSRCSESSEDLICENDEIWNAGDSFKENALQKSKKFERILSCGFGHTALIRNGDVYTWGQTAQGCLGRGPTINRYSSPGPVSWLNGFRLQVTMVACGKNHTAVLTNNGVYTWGCSKYGQLGLGDIQKSPHPRLVTALADENITLVCCGQFHTLALTDQGLVFAWGWGVHGQLGFGTTDDHRVPRLLNALKEQMIVDIIAGHGHSLALSNKGQIYAFGSNAFGQLGTGTTEKCSLPVMVKGIDGKVTALATGYFHNLALTESNSLYTWGSSPQNLRLQAQARKKSKLISQAQSSTSASCDLEFSKMPVADDGQCGFPERLSDCEFPEKDQKDSHLNPSLVDTSNVAGKIVQISCGCHHSALVTDSGSLFTWGRSLDGQLGAGSNKEVPLPTQIGGKGFQVDSVSCGCEFTAAQEKRTGKIYAWGSNSVGQLAIPIKESVAKSLEGKIVMLKSCKRFVRLLDRNFGSNSSNLPKEIPEIPPPTFSYRTLTNHVERRLPNLSLINPEFTEESLHFVLENFSRCIDLSFAFNKGLEYGNYQFISKIAFLQQNYKQSMVYQLKTLQSLNKYRELVPSHCEKVETESSEEEEAVFLSEDETRAGTARYSSLRAEYIEHAKYIIDSYLELEQLSRTDDRYDRGFLIETGIEFWISEKLPAASLEEFFLQKSNKVFRDVAYYLFCTANDNSRKFLNFFSTEFLLELAAETLKMVNDNEDCSHYVEKISKLLAGDNSTSNSVFNKGCRGSGSEEFKVETHLKLIEENLGDFETDCDCLKIFGKDLCSNNGYFFTCGHNYTAQSFQKELILLDEKVGDRSTTNVIEFFQKMNGTDRICDLACPECIRNFLS